MAWHTNTHTEAVRYEHIRHAKTNTQMTHWDRNNLYITLAEGSMHARTHPNTHTHTHTHNHTHTVYADKWYGCTQQKYTRYTDWLVCHGNTMWGKISQHLFDIKLQSLSLISQMERARQKTEEEINRVLQHRHKARERNKRQNHSGKQKEINGKREGDDIRAGSKRHRARLLSCPVFSSLCLLVKFTSTGKLCWLGDPLFWLNKEMRERPASSLTASVVKGSKHRCQIVSWFYYKIQIHMWWWIFYICAFYTVYVWCKGFRCVGYIKTLFQ